MKFRPTLTKIAESIWSIWFKGLAVSDRHETALIDSILVRIFANRELDRLMRLLGKGKEGAPWACLSRMAFEGAVQNPTRIAFGTGPTSLGRRKCDVHDRYSCLNSSVVGPDSYRSRSCCGPTILGVGPLSFRGEVGCRHTSPQSDLKSLTGLFVT